VTDIPAAHVTAQLEAALRTIQGTKVAAHGVAADGVPCESWRADFIRFTLELPVASDTGNRVAATLRTAGTTGLRMMEFTGHIAGRIAATVKMVRLSGQLDDAAAQRLARLDFEFTDAEVDANLRLLLGGRASAAERVRADKGKPPEEVR